MRSGRVSESLQVIMVSLRYPGIRWMPRDGSRHSHWRVPKGGYAQCRSPTFADVPPAASGGISRSLVFGIVRCWLLAFLSRFLSAPMEEFVIGSWAERGMTLVFQ